MTHFAILSMKWGVSLIMSLWRSRATFKIECNISFGYWAKCSIFDAALWNNTNFIYLVYVFKSFYYLKVLVRAWNKVLIISFAVAATYWQTVCFHGRNVILLRITVKWRHVVHFWNSGPCRNFNQRKWMACRRDFQSCASSIHAAAYDRLYGIKSRK
jgi:hypothetical protein